MIEILNFWKTTKCQLFTSTVNNFYSDKLSHAYLPLQSQKLLDDLFSERLFFFALAIRLFAFSLKSDTRDTKEPPIGRLKNCRTRNNPWIMRNNIINEIEFEHIIFNKLWFWNEVLYHVLSISHATLDTCACRPCRRCCVRWSR